MILIFAYKNQAFFPSQKKVAKKIAGFPAFFAL